MRTNIMLNDDLIEEAFKYSSNINSKRELVEIALKEFVENRRMKNLKDIKGKIKFAENYDYKSMRA
jgi:Arc/MetJ family transcription regulator